MGADFDVVQYDPRTHREWVVSTFLRSVDSPIYRGVDLREQFEDHLNDAETLVARVGSDEQLLGWVCRYSPIEVVFGYTKYAVRRMGLMTELAGIEKGRPVSLRYWTRAAMRMVRDHGYSLYLWMPEDSTRVHTRRDKECQSRAPSNG